MLHASGNSVCSACRPAMDDSKPIIHTEKSSLAIRLVPLVPEGFDQVIPCLIISTRVSSSSQPARDATFSSIHTYIYIPHTFEVYRLRREDK